MLSTISLASIRQREFIYANDATIFYGALLRNSRYLPATHFTKGKSHRMPTGLTEQRNPASQNIDQLSTLEMLGIINDEDAKVALVVRNALPDIARAIDAVVTGIQNGGRLIYVGAGTSGRLGVLDASECGPTFSTPPGLVSALIAGGQTAVGTPIEDAEDHPEMGRDAVTALGLTQHDVVVGIAASGRTPYVLGALEAAHQIGAVTVGISCNVPAPLLDMAQIGIGLPVGPEVITGSTRLKAGTAQKMVLNMLTTGSMIRLGKVYGNLMVDMRVANRKLVDRAKRIISEITGVSEDEAGRLLAVADNEIKTAIVVSKRNVTPEKARSLLAEAGGRLRDIIG
jgi:N-acetylmuramic acid 6-phosphate etherase